MPEEQRTVPHRAVAWWLIACCAMIFAMVVIGGITRLTESGLSIVRWEPIGGIVPPLSAADWDRLFSQYQASPQYLQVNTGMTVEEFKSIFWWEYIHRVWGRLIGLVFLLPFLWFLVRGRIPRQLRWPLAGLFVLGGLQGALGWWMVASGLRDVPWVSPYRLTAHLGLALLIYALTLRLAFGLLLPATAARPRHPLRSRAIGLTHIVFLTVLSGGFVAGLDAGLIYNEFPTMGGGLVPPDYRDPALGWLANAFENRAAVQLHHRILAVTTLAMIVAFWFQGRRRVTETGARRAIDLVLAAGVLQVTLGITTLLMQVPVALGAMHQAGATLLLTATVWAAFRLRS